MGRRMAAPAAPKRAATRISEPIYFRTIVRIVQTYIIRADEIDLLSRLPPDYPRPVAVDWINRGTNQALRPSTIAMLKRTLDQGSDLSESVRKLHTSAGLRLTFASERERATFASMIRAAKPGARYLDAGDQSECSETMAAGQSRD